MQRFALFLRQGGGDGQGENWQGLWVEKTKINKISKAYNNHYIQTQKMHPKFFLGTNHKENLWERLEISPKSAVRGLWKRFQNPNLYISCLIQGILKVIARTRENMSWWCPRYCSGERGDRDVIGSNHIHFSSHPLLRMKSLRSCISNLPLLMLISTILILSSVTNVHSSTSSQLSKVTHKTNTPGAGEQMKFFFQFHCPQAPYSCSKPAPFLMILLKRLPINSPRKTHHRHKATLLSQRPI